MNIKHILTIFALAFATLSVFAVPAKKKVITVTQPDGTTLTLQLTGDEHMHYYTNVETGEAMELRADGFYAPLTAEQLTLREARSNQHRGLVAETRAARAAKIQTSTAPNGMRREFGHPSSYTGTKKGLVILVNYTDVKMQSNHGQADWNDRLNLEGYSVGSCIGSVHDYFHDQSYGKFDLNFDVVGPYTLAHEMAYYGGNDANGSDKHPAEMIIEACKLADPNVNFADYDWDGDGTVDQVYVIYAGYGEAQYGGDDTVWPHEYELSSAYYFGDGTGAMILDGVKVDTYATSNELLGSSGTAFDGIGTICHEFSHCLGLPDLYDTQNGTNFGMCSWSVLDQGSYNEDGFVPAAYTAYERMFSGWLTPTTLSEPCDIADMAAITDTPEAYIIYNDKKKTEYYLLQNVQRTGWNKGVGGHGLLVIHVDYSSTVWENNTVNNTSTRQRCTIVPADNRATTNTLAGDPYPGTSGNKALTDDSTPAASLYNANVSGNKLLSKPIEEITEWRSKVSFTFNGGIVIPAPTALPATNITSTGFTANWGTADNAETYTLELCSDKEVEGVSAEESIIAQEKFAAFATTTSDGTSDLSGALDSYFSTTGWTGSRIYSAPSAVKLSSSIAEGYIQTPALNPTTGMLTVAITCKIYGSDANDVTLSTSADSYKQTINVPTEYTTLIYHFDKFTSGQGIKLLCPKKHRVYLNNFTVYDGEFSDEDVLATLTANTRHKMHIRTSKTITDIEDTKYVFTDLDPECTYTYRVQGVSEKGKQGEWSDVITVTLGDSEGIGHTTLRPTLDGYYYDLNPQIRIYGDGRKVLK